MRHRGILRKVPWRLNQHGDGGREQAEELKGQEALQRCHQKDSNREKGCPQFRLESHKGPRGPQTEPLGVSCSFTTPRQTLNS